MKIILIRHGESVWNQANRFTGWEDVPLSDKGIEEAREAGKLLAEQGLFPGKIYTSVLKRAIKTAWLIMEEMDAMYVPFEQSWRLNEKHYGLLQGLDKAETAARYGEAQVLQWRRAFSIAPPPLAPDAPNLPANMKSYAHIPASLLPATESLKDTIDRFLPFWEETIKPAAKENQTLFIVAHGNSLRGLVMKLRNLSEDEILSFNIPTAIPYLFELDDEFNVISHRFLADENELKAKMEAVASQGKTK
jgi:2,3-bisphosphoglycerate-dependent phosphoglycerate mutase